MAEDNSSEGWIELNEEDNNNDDAGSLDKKSGTEESPNPIVIPIMRNGNKQEESPAVDESAIEMKSLDDKAERKARRERLFFLNDPSKRVDYVLAYEDTEDEEKRTKRNNFLQNIDDAGLDLEICDKSESVDMKTYFVLLHATWEAVGTGAELLNLRKRIKMPKNTGGGTCCQCFDSLSPSKVVVPCEDDYFTAPFHFHKLEMFDLNPEIPEERDRFFTNAERSLIVNELLDRTSFTDPDADEQRFGIQRLLNDEVFTASYPLHEGPMHPLETDETPWEGGDKDRSRLYESWARPGRWYYYQPLELIRKYYGEKIGVYFAWLGYYTTALIPAALIGIGVFIYGLVTMVDDKPSNDICGDFGKETDMCPYCTSDCTNFTLEDSCIYAKITYVFDNFATVAFAVIMAIWGVCFLEFWKRYENEIRYEWDVADFELEERMRPEFEFKVKRTKENPITNLREPYVRFTTKLYRIFSSYAVVLTLVCVVVAAIFGVIVYRAIVAALLYSTSVRAYGSIITSITAAIANLIAIVLLNVVYGWVATKLTDVELNRTESEYENSLIFKMFLFKFVNFYGSTFYIAYFKGSFRTYPGADESKLFGKYDQDYCDPAGCMVDLFLHLGFIMIGKQTLNNAKELFLPWILKCYRARSSVKGETSENLYMRWEQDYDAGILAKLGMFEEYLEMVIQFGFVSLFVAAFPLAPLFALINNIIEIRLDAFKFVSLWRRPHAAKAQGIGIWLGILQGISFMAIITNAFIIGWTSDFVPKLVYLLDSSNNDTLDGYVNNSLSVFNLIIDYNNGSISDNLNTTCRYKAYREPEMPYEYTREFYLIFTARLVVVLVFEHICFIITWLISTTIPDKPASVERLRLYEKQLVKKLTFDRTFQDLRTKRKSSRQVMGHLGILRT